MAETTVHPRSTVLLWWCNIGDSVRRLTNTTPGPLVSLTGVAASGPGRVLRGHKMGRPRKKPIIINGETHWICSSCKQPVEHNGFYTDPTKPNGLDSKCKQCRSRLSKERRQKDRRAAHEKDSASYWKNRVERLKKNKQWRENNKDRTRKQASERAKKYPEKTQACSAVGASIKKGTLKRPDQCEMCNKADFVEAHHDSYDIDRWLVVTWLCRSCHRWLHAQRRFKDE